MDLTWFVQQHSNGWFCGRLFWTEMGILIDFTVFTENNGNCGFTHLTQQIDFIDLSNMFWEYNTSRKKKTWFFHQQEWGNKFQHGDLTGVTGKFLTSMTSRNKLRHFLGLDMVCIYIYVCIYTPHFWLGATVWYVMTKLTTDPFSMFLHVFAPPSFNAFPSIGIPPRPIPLVSQQWHSPAIWCFDQVMNHTGPQWGFP